LTSDEENPRAMAQVNSFQLSERFKRLSEQLQNLRGFL
jgi:hypothetical protein